MRKGTTSRPAWFCTEFCRLRRYYIHSQLLVNFLIFLSFTEQSYADDASIFLQIGGVTGLALAATLFLGFGYLTLLFTDDPAVLDIAQSGVWVRRIIRSQYFVSQVSVILYSLNECGIIAVCHYYSADKCYCFCVWWALLRCFWLRLCRILHGAVSIPLLVLPIIAPTFSS